MTVEYVALVEKVDAFTSALAERQRADMQCQAGCDGCCQVWLSVNQVEAERVRAGLALLSPSSRAEVAARGLREQARDAAGAETPRCAMLEPDGRCAIYEHRPLVCRTQGFALRYPKGFIPEAAVRARLASGDVTHCPLNFERAAPTAADTLDAERVDQLLAVVNLRFAHATSLEPDARHTLSALASDAESLDLTSPSAHSSAHSKSSSGSSAS
jgi:Fe-S-cluster containining protein